MKSLALLIAFSIIAVTAPASVKRTLIPAVDTSASVSPAPASPTIPASKEPPNALSITGWVMIGVGAAIILFLSILIGVIIVLGGVVMVVFGKRGKKEKREETPVMEDVVYLKNGSVIRGTIIEQVPNVSIKVQTRDGSVFVYQMTEVEKIAKEKRGN